MPDNNTHRPEDWYRQPDLPEQKEAGLWYSDSSDLVIPRLADAGCSTHQPPPRSVSSLGDNEDKRKKRRRTKIISLSVCACLILVAMVVAAVQIAGMFRVRIITDTAEIPYPELYPGDTDQAETEIPEDYRDYFDSYFQSAAGVDIPQGELGTGVTVELVPAASGEMSYQQVYETVSPAVVGIITYVDGMEYGWGSGVVFTPDGYIITNTHVLSGSDAAMVIFADGTELEATLIGADEKSDIAVIKVEGEKLPYASFGDSESLRVGDEVFAIGCPLGPQYAGTMTDGIISAINRNILYNGHTLTLLQTNAALNEGNSGGPLVNAAGQIIGITNMKIMFNYYSTVEGIGFAIPSTVVKEVADQLIAYGVVLGEPTIGIVAGSVSSQAMALYDLPRGVYVSQVNEGSDAKEKGLREGDVILEVNGIAVTSVAEVNAIKDELQVGDTIDLTVYREGKTFEMTVALVDKSEIE